jgi:SP family general alpha glucoside:H+ symporter-like MFS transporter
MAICYVLLFAGITVEVISHSQSNPNAVFFAGKLINGFAIGGLLATALTYIGEVSLQSASALNDGDSSLIASQGVISWQIAPLALRGILLALSAIAFTVGGIIITVIINSFGTLNSEWAYKSCFVAQYGVTGIVAACKSRLLFRRDTRPSRTLILVRPPCRAVWIFMPESPTWLLSRGRDQHAAQALKRMGHSQVQGEKAIATIKLTLERARAETAGVTYLDW